ncbi:MAG: bifunctional helix-turn-helix transcriptional regulator/GNAT family N-acetyltransferase [Alphaproteobacteria bacterium]
MDTIEEFRSFNRFFTRKVGLLDRHLLASGYTLAEARVLYELANSGEQTAAELGRSLDMDKAHLSRILSRFDARKLIHIRPSALHRRQRLLSLTAAGERAFAALDRSSQDQAAQMLAPLDDARRSRVAASMRQIRRLLEPDTVSAGDVIYRGLQPGDLGRIIERQMVLYREDCGWDWTFEGLVCGIMGKFVAQFDPAREDAWVAEHAGSMAGSIFLMKSDDPATAKLRLLYVEPAARGLGIGRTLVATCIDRARELGYRNLTLWTNDILVSARRLYQSFGFRLTAEEKHHSFGKDLVGQTWVLDLKASDKAQ